MPKHLYEDEAMAQEIYQQEQRDRRVVEEQQLLRDEELARQLARAEERALAAEERARGPPPSRPWTMRRICSYVVPLMIIAIGMVALLYAMKADETIPDNIPTTTVGGPPFFEDEDPWEGLKPGDVVKWSNGGTGGLKLEVIDALESQWEDIFHAVIDDWDNGVPNALELTTEKQGHDAECEPIDNKSKVCNGNYGNTQWRGINQVLIQNGYIVATTSKMNDYYLDKASVAQKRYTMCHEVGHSFGLPHTDENFFNKDLGNCMDYTSTPEANISPDETNFEFLKDLYGTIPESHHQRRLKTNDSQSTTTTSRIPNDIRAKLKEVVPGLENNNRDDAQQSDGGNGEWRLLSRSRHGEGHSMSLGNGWVVEVHKILVLE